MKKLLLVIFVLCLVLTQSGCKRVNFTQGQAITTGSRYTVVIDAGHGGKDCGTIGADGTEEKGINLSIALCLYDFLMVCGIDARLVRSDDSELYYSEKEKSRSDLYNRLDFVNSVKNAALISIHQNHFEDEKEWGCQVWYSKNNPESKVIADNILGSVKHFLQPENERVNKVSDSNYYILYNARVPSVMVECGFMSNINENKLLQNTDYQKKFAFAVLAGICGEV
ncbi:MAG: N-acetylmuramoyl-L-alanine amidase [Eubacterium sp.]|nr:N-acetylmuramoyl-L-alanine amidase [Eubacterium sp.]